MRRHCILISLGFVFAWLLLITPNQTQAKVRLDFGAAQSNASHRVVFLTQAQLLQLAKKFDLKVRVVKLVNLSKHDLEKLAKSSPNGCGCSPQDGGGWGCFTGCLSDAGVSYPAIVACAGICAVSLPACAACVGIGEWIAMYCGMKCAWGDVPEDPPINKNITPRDRGRTQLISLQTRRAQVRGAK